MGAQDPLEIQRMLEQQAARESLSFQSLIQELGDTTPTAGTAPENQPPSATDIPDGSLLDKDEDYFGGTVDGNAYVAPSLKKQKQLTSIEQRLLTGSAAQKTPLWLTSLFIGGASCLLLLPIIFRSSLMVWQPVYSYVVMLLGGGAVFWAVYGMLRDEAPEERWRCLFGIGLGLISLIVAFLMRAPIPAT